MFKSFAGAIKVGGYYLSGHYCRACNYIEYITGSIADRCPRCDSEEFFYITEGFQPKALLCKAKYNSSR